MTHIFIKEAIRRKTTGQRESKDRWFTTCLSNLSFEWKSIFWDCTIRTPSPSRGPACRVATLLTVLLLIVIGGARAQDQSTKETKVLPVEKKNYAFTVSHRYDHFRHRSEPWQFFEAGLQRETFFGPVIGRVQHARRFERDGTQFLIDAYPSLGQGRYAYISGGWSSSSIYPRSRANLSVYQALPGAFVASGGLRYVHFPDTQTLYYSASVGKYWRNYLFTLRMYRIPREGEHFHSGQLSGRRYFNNANTYLGFFGGYGAASADLQFSEDIRTRETWRIGVDGQYPLSERIQTGGIISYDSSRFPGFTRQRFIFRGALSYKF